MTEPCHGVLDENLVRFGSVLEEIVDAAIAISGADFGNIQLIDPKTSDLRIVAYRGFPKWWLDFWNSVSIGHGVCGTALARGERVIVEDVEYSPIFIGTPALEMQRKAGVRAVQSTPIVTREGKPLGMFSTHYKMPRRPDERGILLLDLLARQAADIIERKQAEEALRQSEERFRILFENAPVGIMHVDQNGRLISANQTFSEITGYSPEEAVGLIPADLTLPEERASTKVLLEGLFSGKIQSISRERRLLCKDGSTIWVRITSKMMHGKSGQPQWGMVVFEDIAERKQAEEALRQSEERFRLLYENAPIGITQFDQQGYIESANPKFADISGYSTEEVAGLVYSDVTPPEERTRVAKFGEDLFYGKIDTYSCERLFLRKDESTIWVRETAKLMRDKQGNSRGGIAVYEDIHKRKQAEEALRQSEEKFRATFENAPLGIAESTLDGKITEANPKFLEIMGYTKEEILHLSVRDVTHPSDLEDTLSSIQKLVTGEEDSFTIEKRYIRKDCSFLWANTTASLVRNHGKPQHLVVIVEDITARKKVDEDLKRAIETSYHLANHDTLTGLANRASCRDRLQEALTYAKRDGHLVAVHLLDLDRFKFVNDTLGHHVGDLLLKDVAKRIKSHVRVTDLAARLGGDEFVVIQTLLAEPAGAGVLASKLVEDLRHKYMLEDQEVHSGASIGIAVYPNDAEDPDELIRHADLALYDAKHRGRFNYQFYRKELGAAFHEAQGLEKELVRGLRGNEFFLHYQPQFDLKNGHMTGIEALLRWRHPTRGELAASEFIQEAEREKLMLPLGEWILLAACRQYKTWSDCGLAVPLTLNISSIQLRDPRLLQTLQRVLQETGLPASMLQLAMRESMLWDSKFSNSLLKQMKESGLRLALNDFGGEMTALSTLNKFPLDVVKPGKGVVKELPSGKQEASILAAIIGVAHNRKIAVCADGVETDSQLAAVKDQGCDSVQGYLLSTPLDADEMTRRIQVELVH
ncbi:PAS domain S-box protein [Herbaspirillum sp. HC18]|nr:PAS domain S-box protein [Herbaspirillum sp. HC18]